MSCHFITDVNYDALLTYLLMPSTPADFDTCTQQGLILKHANAKSYSYRYKQPMDNVTYSFTPKFLPEHTIIPIAILKLCEYYDYQTCELPYYESSKACEIIRAIRQKATVRLKGYEEAPWGLTG